MLSQSDARVELLLPIDVESGGYTLSATNQAGTNQTGVTLELPDLTLEDAANAAYDLVRGLGIGELACLLGNSMGGMTALAFCMLFLLTAPSSLRISVPEAFPSTSACIR